MRQIICLLCFVLVMGIGSNSVFANEKITVLLDWFVNPDHGPLYVALEKGYFKERGLDVAFHAPSNPNDPPKLAAARKADIAVSYQPQHHLHPPRVQRPSAAHAQRRPHRHAVVRERAELLDGQSPRARGAEGRHDHTAQDRCPGAGCERNVVQTAHGQTPFSNRLPPTRPLRHPHCSRPRTERQQGPARSRLRREASRARRQTRAPHLARTAVAPRPAFW